MVPVFDAHAHAYPDGIAQRAVENLCDFYRFCASGDGTFGDLAAHADATLKGFLLFSVATTPHQVPRINDFIAARIQEACKRGFQAIGFGGMHQDFPDKAKEVDRLIGLGLRGIKIHPDIQGVAIDDPRMMELYEIIEGRIPVYFHTGDDRPQYPFSHPKRILTILDRFPKLQVISAHLGGYRQWDDALALAGHPQIWYDTSSSLWSLPEADSARLIRKLGVHRIFFGTDYPLKYPEDELTMFRKVPLTEEEQSLILYENAREFFGLEALQ